MNERRLPAFPSDVQRMSRGGGGEALLIDAGLDDSHVLAAGARAGMDIAPFGGPDDGLAGLAAWALGHDGYDALHIVCHGAPGRLMLGARILDAAALAEPAVLDALAAIGGCLSPGGAVLLYACDVARGAAGADFVAALSRALGAPVAAATGVVGAPALGASWDLDVATAALPVAPHAWPAYAHTLTTASTTTTFSTIPAGVNTNYAQLTSGYATPGTLTQTDVAGSGWDVTAQSSNAATTFVIRGIGSGTNGDGDSNALRIQASDVDYVTFKSNANGFYFDLGSFAVRNGVSTSGTVQALDASGNLVGSAVAFSVTGGTTYTHVSLAGNTDFQQIFGFKVTFDGTVDAPFFDNLVVSNIGTPAAPTTTVSGASLSVDSGTSGDFVTNTAAQTISGTLSSTLASGDKVEVSFDGGSHWSDATSYATGSASWSTTATLSGSDTFMARVTNAYGSSTAFSHAYTLDATAPASLALGTTTVAPGGAGSGATVGTLSATDATTVTYALATGNGTNDADNGSFAVSGNTLSVGGSTLAAGTYHVYLSATDAAGNVSHLAETITVQGTPTVASIVRAGGAGAGVATASTSVDYTVTFSENVTGVDAGDFTLTATGTASGSVSAVSGSGSTYTVTVNGLSGDGTLRLDLNGSGTGIQNGSSVAIGAGYTAGQTYTLDHTAPSITGAPDLSASSDSGSSSSDDITNHTSVVVTGSAESGSTVTLYDTDGTTVLGTTTASGGTWSITTSTLAEGDHTLSAKAVDAAGNVASAPGTLALTVDTTAPSSVILGTTTVAVTGAGSGAIIGTLSATDATTVTYSLATGNGTNDADNGSFAISGSTLTVGGSALSAGTYHVYLVATDAAGNVSNVAETITVANVPSVSSIERVSAGAVSASAGSVDYTVKFSESVTGVDASDFALTATGTASGTISAVSGSGDTYTVTVNGLSGDGTLRLDLNGSGTGIQNGSSVAISAGYTTGQTYTLDHTAPSITGAPDLSASSDSGSSSSDDVTNHTSVVVTGSAESGSTVTLYDTDGTTVLGSTTASGGAWSITTSTLAEGGHTLSAKAADAAGNVASAPGTLALTVDTTAPSSVILGTTTVAVTGAGSGATIGTLSATDATTVTYSLATGNGTNDADNGSFAISGSTLSVGGAALSAGTYHVYLAATDAAGNVSNVAETITVANIPSVSSIERVSATAVSASAGSVDYTVKFSEGVTGVDANDFALTATGTASGTISAVSGSGDTYTVTVNGLSGDGTLRLDLNGSGTGIQNGSSVAIGAGYMAGQTYTLDHTAPSITGAPDLATASDSGSSSSDDITNHTSVVVTGSAESGSTVTLYDTDGTTVLGTTTASGGTWSITTSTLAEGDHTLSAKAVDAAGNVASAPGTLAMTVDTTAPSSVTLGTTTVTVPNAGSGATIGTLSATDATTVTYSLATGNGTNDADNGSFAISGSTLSVGGSALTAGTYHVYLAATDAAGNVEHIARTITVQNVPSVASIERAAAEGVAASASSINYTVKFSESVTGVDASDFALTATGTASGTISAVSGSGDTYTVTVNSLSGDGTLRLDLNGSGTGIQNGSSVAIGAGYTAGQTYTLDHTAPSITGAPDLSASSDSGSSSSDDITNHTSVVVTGSAESGSTVTLYDTDGTTVLGTTTASGGTWSITTSTLAEGAHTLSAKAADAAGNVASAPGTLALTVDTTAPSSVTLGTTTVAVTNAGSGATIGTLSATDATTVTYSLATGNGTNDADNGSFAISGSTLSVGGSALTAGTYHVYLAATDAAGNVEHIARTITVQSVPSVVSIERAAAEGVAASASSINYTVKFSESVTGVDANDFALTATGTAGGTISAVSGSGDTYTVTVNSLSGDGTLRLDLNGSGTGIQNGSSVAISAGYTAGQTYTLDHTAPSITGAPDLATASDSGSSSTDNITNHTSVVVTGSAESGSTVTLYDTDGTTVLGTTTASGGTWSITTSTLAEGAHTLSAKAVDAAGNVASAPGTLALTVDTTAPSSVTLGTTTVTVPNAGSGATIGTLSATDATSVTYSLATGNGTNDADNGSFAISGSTLSVGGAALAAGTYHVYLAATDAAGNVEHIARTITVQNVPSVASIERAAAEGVAASASSINYTVKFSESVTGVDASDFALTATGTASGTISAVSGSGDTYTVTVNSLSGDGTLRLDLNGSGTGIQNGSSVAIGAGYTAGQTYTLDHTAPSITGAPDLATASDSGSSSTDDITNHTSVVVTGSAESGSTVTLYDTDGTTVLGTTTASGGTWSITTSTLAEGAHTLGAKAVDAAGNVASAPGTLALTVDTTAPSSVTLGTTTVTVPNAGSGATIGTLSATDATTVTYSLATGNGTNDADNGNFAISGSTLSVGGAALSAGTYHVYLAATDAAGNVEHIARTITVQSVPSVVSIERAAAEGVAASASSVNYTVKFSESVSGVDAGDFSVTHTGTAGGTISAVTGSGDTYTVTVNALTGDGTLRLDLNGIGTGIHSSAGVAIASGYASGQTYALDHTPPAAPTGLALRPDDDSGTRHDDGVTNVSRPHVVGVADAGALVRVYGGDGATLLGTATADAGGHWSFETPTLAAGFHMLTARQVDAAGNVSAASDLLFVTVIKSVATPAAPVLDAASDSGAAGDGLTKVKTPVVSGTAGASATVTLYDTDGTTVLGTTTADVHGAWRITSAALADGLHTLTVRQTDVAGNVSAASPVLQLTVDATAPAAPAAPALAPASDLGTVGDGTTWARQPVVTGHAEAHAAVTLYDTDGTTVLGTATADGDGNWSITSATLALGQHHVTVTQADAAGNVSTASAALDLAMVAEPAPPATTIDGVQVGQQPVVLPGGGIGVATSIPIVTPGRVESTGSAGVADIPLVAGSGAPVLLAQVGLGFGLTASGGGSHPAGTSAEQLVQAIVAATPDHPAADQAHLTGNGQSFLHLLPSQVPLLVQTVVPVTAPGANGSTLTLTGTSTPAQHTALVIDASGVGAGNTLALKGVDFAAIIGAATVSGNTSGQILTGDAAGQTFVVGATLGGSVFAGGGDDTLRLASGTGPVGADGAAGQVHAAAGVGATTLMHGGLGADTAAFAGARADYTIAWHDGHEVVTANGGAHEQAIVVNAETLRFADGDVAVQDRPALAAIAGLYATVLGRQADVGGFDYWGTWEKGGATLGQVALAMIGSTEAQGRLAAFNGDAAHDVAILYTALFGRAADTGGLDFWTDAMGKGATLEQVADQFMHSAEIVGHALDATRWDFQA
jgi:uncharacterized protein YbcV (DUF1398 family)